MAAGAFALSVSPGLTVVVVSGVVAVTGIVALLNQVHVLLPPLTDAEMRFVSLFC